MDNYIVINGKKVELTEEQLKKLVIEVKKDIFIRGEQNSHYYFIDNDGTIKEERDDHFGFDDDNFNVANYCTDKAVMEQRALHETLNRLLWRYSMQHDGDKISWDDFLTKKYKIYLYHDYGNSELCVTWNDAHMDTGTVYFIDSVTANKAVEEIVKPFMKEHPEFKW